MRRAWTRISVAAMALAGVACHLAPGVDAGSPDAGGGPSPDAAVDSGMPNAGPDAGTDSGLVLGLSWPVATYEAEAGRWGGSAILQGSADGSDRLVGDLGGEASQRQAVTLADAGDWVSWTVQATEQGANALVLRFSLPDAPDGGGQMGALDVVVADSDGGIRYRNTFSLTSRYAWLYGGVKDGTKLYNVPANAAAYGTADTPTHLYDEVQLELSLTLNAGDVLTLTEPAAAPLVTVDFVDLETVPAPIGQPPGFIGVTDPRCGAVSLDTRGTGTVFDGADDSSYGSTFLSVLGHNPYNPPSFGILEKDYYATGPLDLLQDQTPNADAGGLSMFGLADRNLASLKACLDLVAASDGGYRGVFIPPGRFYVRGVAKLADGAVIQGAGMWYSKFTAVDTASPLPVGADAGIAATSGDFVFESQDGGASGVVLANFSMFGNVTQRDTVDAVAPFGVHGVFAHSLFDNLWVEHYFIGLNMNGESNAVVLSHSRVRDTFADGLDFYGSTSNSLIDHCQARSTGDDGFALWAQGTTAGTVSQANQVSNSESLLGWYGNGFALYGGIQDSVIQSRAADILNYPCLQVSTQFVPASLPSTSFMTARASYLNFYRCGGDGFNQAFGALLVGVNAEDMDGVSLDHINIASPAYKGIDIRPVGTAPSSSATATHVTFSNIEVLGALPCGAVGANAHGDAGFINVCSCTTATGTPMSCSPTNASPTTFEIVQDTCATSACFPF
jgi:hypothetical protein